MGYTATDAAYEDLPVAIKTTITHREWSFLSDEDKARLEQNETEPETFED